MNKIDKYRELCKVENSIPLFSQPWWLDAVCGENSWDVCLVEKGRKIYASMPYYLVKEYGFVLIKQPKLTQTSGPWFRYEDSKYSKKLANEKDMMEALIEQLPHTDSFNQNWHYKQQNWLPFYWKGFSQTTNYTYVIDDISNVELVISSFDQSKRKNIKKSEKIVSIKYDLSASDFYENHKMTLKKQGSEISYSFELFKRIYDAAYNENAGKTIAAFDDAGNLHAALFVIWDGNSAYDLISTIDPSYRSSGAASLLIKEIVSYLSDKTKSFDFEGSMIEPVERSFRQFGAKQKPYFTIYKNNSKLLLVARNLRTLLGRFK